MRPRRSTTGAVGWLAAAAVALLVVPLVALAARVPWSAIPEVLTAPAALAALRLSLFTATAALALSTVLGLPLAWLLARGRLPGRRLLHTAVVLPMVLPPVVGGVALLTAFGRRGLVGGALAAAGITVPFTPAAVVLAETFVAMPFLVVTAEAGFATLDRRLEEAAATLGAGRWTTFRRVTVPLVAPSLAAGMALTWARALGEFGATITFAGNLPGVTQTMPVAVYLALQNDPPTAIVLSLLLLASSLAVLAGLRGWPAR